MEEKRCGAWEEAKNGKYLVREAVNLGRSVLIKSSFECSTEDLVALAHKGEDYFLGLVLLKRYIFIYFIMV